MGSDEQATLAIIVALSTSIALADDFKTINGKEYKNATVTRAEVDGMWWVLAHRQGISDLYALIMKDGE